MHTKLISISVLIITLSSCKKTEADFSISDSNPKEFESVTFSNSTIHGERFVWNFGDGKSSEEENPTHIYNNFGPQTISLISYGKDDKNISSKLKEINVEKSSLRLNIEGNWILDSMIHLKFDENNKLVDSSLWGSTPMGNWEFKEKNLSGVVGGNYFSTGWKFNSQNSLKIDYQVMEIEYIDSQKMRLVYIDNYETHSYKDYYYFSKD